jgi:hypothetical protein
MTMTTEPFEGYAILELMGHRQRPGWVREVEMAGTKMMRVDMPVSKDDAGQDVLVTEFYGGSSIYSLRPCAEEIVRDWLKRYGDDPRPIRPLEYREREKPPSLAHDDDPDDDIPR